MGNGVSANQGNLLSHGSRDVKTSICQGQQAEAPETHSLSTNNAKSYSGASNVGLKSSTEDNVRVGANVRSVLDSYSGAQLRGSKSPENGDVVSASYSGASNVGPKLSRCQSRQQKTTYTTLTVTLPASGRVQ